MELILLFFAIFLIALLLFALIVTFGLMRRRKHARVAEATGPQVP